MKIWPTYELVFSFFVIFISFRISAQEIKVQEFKVNPRDISARENAVLDANGDACAIIKVRSGLQNLKFSTDMGIRKIESQDGEYWLWVSPNTSQITIEAEEIGTLDYELPVFTEEYIVYVILLSAKLPDRVIFTNTNSIKVETEPSGAKLYIDSVFMGYTPLDLTITSDTFEYEVRKKRYIPVSDHFICNSEQNNLFFSLQKSPSANRWYFMLYGSGGNKYGIYGGMETGRIGKTGWYISFAPPLRTKEYIATVTGYYSRPTLEVDVNNFSSIVGEPSTNYYMKLQPNNNTFFNHFRLRIGLSQRIFRNTFLKAGIGFAGGTQWFKLDVIPYSIDPFLEIPLNEAFYAKREYSITTLAFETGLAIVFSDNYIANLSISSTGFSQYFQDDFVFIKPATTSDFFLPLECSMGFGYIF